MRFICDQMFGTLASWLRLLGFDTYYTTEQISDKELLEIASNDNRTLITRDKNMVIQAKRMQIPVLYLDSTDLDTQILKVLQQTDTEIADDQVLTRCSLCNAVLHPVEKNRVADLVPENVFSYQHEFFRCPRCEKIYWKGSHYQKILKKIVTIKKQLSK